LTHLQPAVLTMVISEGRLVTPKRRPVRAPTRAAAAILPTLRDFDLPWWQWWHRTTPAASNSFGSFLANNNPFIKLKSSGFEYRAMRGLFTIDDSFHGRGSVLFSWQPDGNFLATAGGNGLVHIFDRHGAQVGVHPSSILAPSVPPRACIPTPSTLHTHTPRRVFAPSRASRSLALLALRCLIAPSLASSTLPPPLCFHLR